MSVKAESSGVLVEASTPYLQLKGTEGSAANLKVRENAGALEIYDMTTAAVVKTLYPAPVIEVYEHLPINPQDGSVETASETWKKAVLEVPSGGSIKILACGVIPANGDTFGQATNYFTLSLVNKGTGGSGTTVIASKAFNSTVSNLVKTSLGAISNDTVASGEILALEKTVTSSGQVCQACLFYIEYQRLA